MIRPSAEEDPGCTRTGKWLPIEDVRKQRLLSIFMSCLVYGCVSTTVTVEPFPAEYEVSGTKIREYPSPWDALKSLDFAAVDRMDLSDDPRAFSRSLHALISGDEAASREGFREILSMSSDDTARKASFEILSRILFEEYRWTELLELKERQPPDQDPSFWVLPQAYSGLPAERVDFPEESVTLPLSMSPMGNPIVEVGVNGRSRRFWIDTGAGLTVVSSDVARESGMEALAAGTANAEAAAGHVESAPAVIREFSIGKVVFHDHPAVIIKREDMEFSILGFLSPLKIDGIIGWPALRHLRMVIDFAEKTVTLDRPISLPTDERNLFSLGVPVVRATAMDGGDLYFGVDTSSNSSFISDALLAKSANADVERKFSYLWGVGGATQVEVTRLKELFLTIGDSRLHIKNIATGYPEVIPFIVLDGTLGSDAMKETRMTIDHENGIFDLEKPAP
jgi:clan AA aspartic protease (TIGR02281 family)